MFVYKHFNGEISNLMSFKFTIMHDCFYLGPVSGNIIDGIFWSYFQAPYHLLLPRL